MSSEPDKAKSEKRLQLEYSGGGPNNKARTAIGAGADDGNGASLTAQMRAEPLWFKLIQAREVQKCRRRFDKLSLEEGLSALEAANIPSVTRLALGLKWGFINADTDGFSYIEFDQLIFDHDHLVDRKFRPLPVSNQKLRLKFRNEELQRIEVRAAYQIWQLERTLEQNLEQSSNKAKK